MTSPNDQELATRVSRLETQLRRTRWLALSCALLLAALSAAAFAPRPADVLRARGLIILDEKGRERIYLGSPVPDPVEGKRMAPGTGMVINDTAGVERFGLSLFPNGNMNMGFDAPPHTGDDRNRERINISAERDGGAYIRFLGRDTWVKAFLRLEDDDKVYFDMLDFPPGKRVMRRIGLHGDTTVTESR